MNKIPFLLLTFLSLNIYGQTKCIHVLVALCDNENQGIVPVPKAIGNGQDPANNLYWGCGYGVKTFFKKQKEWILIKQINKPISGIYERLVFKHQDSSIFLIADAYDGAQIKQTIIDFLNYASGKNKIILKVDSVQLKIGGNSQLICYVGHNGLMDFTLDTFPEKADEDKRDVIIMACASKNYFYEPIKKTGANPLIWTSNLMCPEAYTLDTAIDSWIIGDRSVNIREKVAQTYNQYQKCGIKGARNLFLTGY